MITVLALPAAAAETVTDFHFHRDNVLGTSLDLTVRVPDRAQADAVEKTVLDEAERLRKILSTYDAASEICRAAAADAPVNASPDLLQVLDACEYWRTWSGGAFNAQLGDLVALWSDAAKANRLPDAAALNALCQRMGRPTYRIDKPAATFTRLDGLRLNVDALAKGYIIEKAYAAARKADPAMTGLMLDIGGDIRVWGSAGPAPDTPWIIGIADPKHSQENAPLLARLRLAQGAVASSGHYERYHTIGGKRYSHILDPRTGWPVDRVLGATAVAPDAATADALATLLCVLPPQESLDRVASLRGVECLILGADGRRYASAGWKALEVAEASGGGVPTRQGGGQEPYVVRAPDPFAAPADAWPAGGELTIALTLAKRGPRPYVAIWIESAAGRPVRTLTVWGNEAKYVKKLTNWWRLMGSQKTVVNAVTRASRTAGAYRLAWDGKDDQGRPVPPGEYTVRVESTQEDGPHLELRGAIACGGQPAQVQVPGNKSVTDLSLTYGSGNGK